MYTPPSSEQRTLDRDTAARTLWAEARGDGRQGMHAVMNVIMNRCAKPGWWSRQKGDGVADDTVQAVCRDPWQFSCWNPNDPNLGRLLQVDASNDAFREALELVDLALSDQLPDITFGATHYHALEVAPAWAQTKSPCAVYGRHAFYNDIN